ncbi:hypothetical protein IAU59_005558 [Kwoniella sp. CBS 9459]
MASSAQLQNVYYERKTGTPRPCFICNRPTQTVLATLKTEDFLYTCDGHLTDPASPIAPPITSAGPSADDIKKVISDYHTREARKAEKGKDKDKDKNETDTGKDKDKDEKEEAKSDDKAAPSSSVPSTPSTPTTSVPVSSTPPAPTHKKFALHRHIFEMRKHELRRKEQGAKAKEVSKGLPQVPRTAF